MFEWGSPSCPTVAGERARSAIRAASAIAETFARLGRHLIIEFVPKEDSQVQRMLRSRPDIFPQYTRDGFEAAFGTHFRIEDAQLVSGSERHIYLMTNTGGA